MVVSQEGHEWLNGACSEWNYVCVNGWKDYYKCACGKYFADEARTTPISDLETWKANDGKISAKHEYGDLIPEESAVHFTSETIMY